MNKMKDLRRTLFWLMLLALTACASVSNAQTGKPSAKPQPTAAANTDREATDANWKEFSSAAGRFSILFPDKP
ncbi:MAG: hypothetical protein JO360_14495, partial [Acidobacteria bacterium]|nr:hypothetical protein [Acidobacteriota bacterium]